MKYIKNINNNTIIKEAKHIIVHKNGKQIINPSRELLLEDGWKEYNPTIYEPEEESISVKKKTLIEEIITYDSSDEVNVFYINGLPVWLDKNTRAGLKLRFEAEIAKGKTVTTLWHENMEFPLLLNLATQMLYDIEVYASDCYDNTQRHIAEVNRLEDIQAIEGYDYTTGYPDKLTF